MSRRRKKRRSKSKSLGTRGSVIFAGASFLMLLLLLALIAPRARAQHISVPLMLGFTVAMWALCVAAVFFCLRSRRRRYTHGRLRHSSTPHDYAAYENEDFLEDAGEQAESKRQI